MARSPDGLGDYAQEPLPKYVLVDRIMHWIREGPLRRWIHEGPIRYHPEPSTAMWLKPRTSWKTRASVNIGLRPGCFYGQMTATVRPFFTIARKAF